PAVSGLELLELLLLELPLLPQAASTTLAMTARPPGTPLFRGKALALTGETGNMVFISFHSDRFRTLSCGPRLLTQASRHEEPTQADEQDLDRKGERHPDRRRDQQGEPAVPELLQDTDRYPAGTVPLRRAAQPVPRVAQEAHAASPCSFLAVRPMGRRGTYRRWGAGCQGVSSLRAPTSRTSQTSASAMMSTRPTMISVGKLRWYPSMNRYPRLLTPMSWPTLARLMLETVAIRSPALTMGTAIGSSTWIRRRSVPKPMAVAACRTGSGTARSPSTTFGSRTHSENSVSGMITVVSV